MKIVAFRHRHSPSPAPAGFTLIELVAILFVCCLLALTVSPMLARTRTSSAQVICMNNLRHLMQGAIMYATEHRDYLPYPNWGNSTPGWLYSPIAGSPPKDMSLSNYATGQIWGYVADTNAYRCPLDSPSGKYFSGRANKLSTYVMNGAVCSFGSSPKTWQLSRFDERAFCLWEPDEFLGSPPMGSFAYNDASSFPDRNEGCGRKHPGGTPVATFGGDARWISYSFFLAEQSKNTASLVWCTPDRTSGR